MRTHTAGGPHPHLPENWKAPYGYAGGPVAGALWVGAKAATNEDLAALAQLDGTPDTDTLVGVLSPDWNATQYGDVDRDAMQPWETFPCPGGKGSAAYKFQLLPEGVTVAHPRWWIYRNGMSFRASGGEPITRMSVGHGHWEYQVVDIAISWAAERQLWVVQG